MQHEGPPKKLLRILFLGSTAMLHSGYEKVFAERVQTGKGGRAESSLHSTVHTKIFLGTQQGTLIGAAPPESRLEGYGRG